MKIIGLTGKSGSGKGMVADLLEEYGIPHIDCDQVYHSLLTPNTECTAELRENFGNDILAQDGSVDRKKLSASVFCGNGHEKRLEILNKITHKYVLAECRKLIDEYKSSGKEAVTVDAPTLFESGFDHECDIILVIVAPENTRLKRITARDGITTENAMARLAAQRDDSFYTQRADFIIENSSDISALKRSVEKFILEKLK